MPQRFTLPVDPPRRESMLCIRLTLEERDAINSFATQLNKPVSRVARHFILQAVQYHKNEALSEKGGVEVE